VSPDLFNALTGYFPVLVPEAILIAFACLLFLGATWRGNRRLWGLCALAGLGFSSLAVWGSTYWKPTQEVQRDRIVALTRQAQMEGEKSPAREQAVQGERNLRASVFASPIQHNHLSILFKILALAGGALLVLFSWDEVADDHAAEYHACLLTIIAGICFTGAANDLITLFLALELVSIPTYILLYLPRTDGVAQEAAMKYFLLSVFSSGLTLFGFSYLYGLTGTTNLPALLEALGRREPGVGLPALSLVALVMVVAGLGFRITAVPFHFYAPDVYQGTTPGAAALLAYVPKVAGFAALIRVLGFVPPVLPQPEPVTAAPLGGVSAVLFYLIAYGAMTIGAFAILHYLSSPKAATLPRTGAGVVAAEGGRRVETVEDLTGLGRTHPGVALLMVLFLFSLIGIPWTAGFTGKVLLFGGALEVPGAEAVSQVTPQSAASFTGQALGKQVPVLFWILAAVTMSLGNVLGLLQNNVKRMLAYSSVAHAGYMLIGLAVAPLLTTNLSSLSAVELQQQHRLYVWLALIAVINAAIGAWYYLRIAIAMFLRDPIQPVAATDRGRPVLLAIWVCALITLVIGVYPAPVRSGVQEAVRPPVSTPLAATPTAAPRLAAVPPGP
jgi:NADH-quinone oxidoreductase subunit N